MRIIRILRELKNYFFLIRAIRKNKNTEKWRKHNLRTGWFGTMATVINLPPEVFQGEEVYYQAYVIEQMRPVNEYLESLNLQEIIYPTVTSLVNKDEGVYAFLVKYRPIFNYLTFWWVLTRCGLLSVFLFLQLRYSLLSRMCISVWGYIMQFFQFIDRLLS